MSSKIYPIHTEMDSARNIYKGTSVTVNVCCYRITHINNVPVLEYLLLKNSSDKLSFPEYQYSYSAETKTVKELSVDHMKSIFSDEPKVTIKGIGVKRYNDELYVFIEILGGSSLKEELYDSCVFWFANMYDILNNRSLYVYKIVSKVYMFFYKNKPFTKLTTESVPKTLYKRIKYKELYPFLIFDYIHTDTNHALYGFPSKCPKFEENSVLLKYLYLYNETSNLMLSVYTGEDITSKELLGVEYDVLILGNEKVYLKTTDRNSLILYSYYTKNKTS